MGKEQRTYGYLNFHLNDLPSLSLPFQIQPAHPPSLIWFQLAASGLHLQLHSSPLPPGTVCPSFPSDFTHHPPCSGLNISFISPGSTHQRPLPSLSIHWSSSLYTQAWCRVLKLKQQSHLCCHRCYPHLISSWCFLTNCN